MAGPYPLATLACTVSATGISSPSFADVYASLQASFQSIYGSDSVIDPDSQDGQMLAVFAQAVYDANQATIAAYNNFSPATAVGVGLSNVVKINGIRRDAATLSSAVLTLTGTAGTVITNGLVGDNQSLGTQWALPTAITIPPGGTINVTAVSTTPGAVAAASGTLTVILNPQNGWQTSTNGSNASLGAPVQGDASLRQKQSTSTAGAALTPIGAVYAAVGNVAGVTELKIYENDTTTADSNGVPGHSICVVVAGGAVVDVATAIAAKKTPGTGTFGTTSFTVFDEEGVPNVINYDVLANTLIDVTVTGSALSGFVTSTKTTIQNAIAAYVNALTIGSKVQWGKLFAPADLAGSAATASSGLTQAQLDALSATYDVTAITLAIHGNALNPADVAIAFNAAAVANTITVNIT